MATGSKSKPANRSQELLIKNFFLPCYTLEGTPNNPPNTFWKVFH